MDHPHYVAPLHRIVYDRMSAHFLGWIVLKQGHTNFLLIGIDVCATVLTGSVAADTAYDVSVVQDGVVDITEYPVMPGRHDVVMGTSEWSAPEPDDPSSPFRGLHGICFGMTEFQGDEVVGGGGYCEVAREI